MLYILLVIIAVGVLLMSEEGKKILGWLFVIALIGGGLYVGFWVVMIIIGLISGVSENTMDDILSIVGILFFGIIIFLYISNIYKKIKNEQITRKTVTNSVKKFLIEMWQEHKIAVVFLGASLLFITYLSIFRI